MTVAAFVATGLHFPKCGTSFGSTLHGYLCQKDPSPPTDPFDKKKKYRDRDIQTECAWCGNAKDTFEIDGVTVFKGRGWRGYDPVLEKSIPWDEKPFCDWNVTYTGAIKNHFALDIQWKDTYYPYVTVHMLRII